MCKQVRYNGMASPKFLLHKTRILIAICMILCNKCVFEGLDKLKHFHYTFPNL